MALAVTCQFPDSFTVALCSVAPSLGRPPSLEELVSSFHAASLTPCVSVSLSVCPFSSCLPFLFALRAYHFISHVCQIRGRSIVKVSLSLSLSLSLSRGELPHEPSKHAVPLKYSCHTIRTRSRRQTASLMLPSNYTHGALRRTTPDCPKQSMQSAPPEHDSASPRHRRSPA